MLYNLSKPVFFFFSLSTPGRLWKSKIKSFKSVYALKRRVDCCAAFTSRGSHFHLVLTSKYSLVSCQVPDDFKKKRF